ncbi:MAG: Lrp/AsnC ligand binding domain-containing protein [Candidatus Nitrosocaldus sp.]
MRAYIEIDLEPGRDVIASASIIRQIDGVKEAHAVSEHCDILAIIEAKDFKGIYNIVMRKIQIIKGVSDTRILPCVDI